MNKGDVSQSLLHLDVTKYLNFGQWNGNKCEVQLPRSIIHGQWGGYYGLNVHIPLKFMLRSEHAKVMVLEERTLGRH